MLALACVCGATAVTITAAPAVAPAAPPGTPPSASAAAFDACAPAAGTSWAQDQLLCLYRVGLAGGVLPETRSRLVELGAGRRDQPWPTLVLGYATEQQDEEGAIALYESAASGFAASLDAEGEVLARHNLRNIYHRRGRAADAARQVARALAAAGASRQPLAVARAAVLEASQILETGGDVNRAYRTLRRAQQHAFPGGPMGLRRTILFNLANASFYLGRLDEAIEALERHRALRQEDGSTADAAAVSFNLLNARLTQAEVRPRPGARERLVAEAHDVLAEVLALARPALVARTHRVLADLLRTTDTTAASDHLDRCLEIATSLAYPELRAGCLWTMSLAEARTDASGAERASRQALAALAANADGPLLLYAWQARLRLVWQTMAEADAVAASLQALDAVERLRHRQTDEDGRAGVFSSWTRDYQWLTGQLLAANPPRLQQAFEVGERLRARVLLDRLAQAGLPAAGQPRRRQEPSLLQQQIVNTQRQLLEPAFAGERRHALLDQLRLLEIEQREETAVGDDVDAEPLPFASLDAIRAALDEDEALLWYSVAPWHDTYGDFGGGAWLLSVTREAQRVYRLPDTADLDSQVLALTGLLQDRNTPADAWGRPADRLGRLLLGPAVAGLPAHIRHLVIASDGELHLLPFEVLRPAAGAPPLGDRFEVTLAPSATLWLHLRTRRQHRASPGALVFADPELLPGSATGELRLAALPGARREGRAIARTLRLEAGQLREGAAASEQFIKQARLDGVAVLHFAAHARSDEAFPDRSAVFLAPGDQAEDGWLQPQEIAALGLSGQLVVLSACESGSGFLLSGEGPLSLARAFFAGGAGAVLATRWPLRDDDAAFLMERFYAGLAAGDSAAAALQRVRREAIERGLPAAAWAGLALLGDSQGGVLTPVAPAAGRWRAVFLSVAAVLLLALVSLTIRVAPRRPGSAQRTRHIHTVHRR